MLEITTHTDDLSDFDHEQIRRLANQIGGAFVWSRTPQGHTYWATVHHNLMQMIGEQSSFPLTIKEPLNG